MEANEVSMSEIISQLDRLERAVISKKNVLTLEEVVQLTSLSRSYLYKLTSAGRIPHYKPHGKLIYFDRVEVERWLLQNPIKTASQIETEAANFVEFNEGRAGK
jgi:excisionase family DNA binding protein